MMLFLALPKVARPPAGWRTYSSKLSDNKSANPVCAPPMIDCKTDINRRTESADSAEHGLSVQNDLYPGNVYAGRSEVCAPQISPFSDWRSADSVTEFRSGTFDRRIQKGAYRARTPIFVLS